MTLRHIEIFIKVFQLLNITKAAEALYMTQPAVSRAIQEIERFYGKKLFDRINHRLYPTNAGKSLYQYALHIYDSFNQLEKSFKDVDKKGIIKIGATITIGNTLLPKVLKILKKRYENIVFKVYVSNAEIIENAIINGLVDFAVIEGELFDDQFIKEKIGEDELMPVLPYDSIYRNKRVSLEKLAAYPFLLREKGSVGRNLIDYVMELNKINYYIGMESESTQAIIKSVHEGVGISFLPKAMLKEHLSNKYISTCTISNARLNRNNYVVWHKYKYLTNIVKDAIETFKKNYSKVA